MVFVEIIVYFWDDYTISIFPFTLYIGTTLETNSVEYPVNYSLKGTYDREDNGNIKSCSLLNRIYYVFDAMLQAREKIA